MPLSNTQESADGFSPPKLVGAAQLSRVNNFDLLRLLAATQVLVAHSARYLEVPTSSSMFVSYLLKFCYLFPGVPIFFAISGFLISRSLERHSGKLMSFFHNRFLRIYPALWACLAFSIASVLVVKPTTFYQASARDVGLWLVAQITIFQFWNPSFLRSYGNGVLNGSLWTIVVELQFYIVLPLMYKLFGLRNAKRNGFLIGAIVVLAGLNWHMLIVNETLAADAISFKLYKQTFVPHFFMFMIGVFCHRNFERVHHLVAGRAFLWFCLYISLVGLSKYLGMLPWNPLALFLLAMLVMACAFSWPSLSLRIFRGNDISYGTYLYHIPVVNAFRELGLVGHYFLLVAVAATVYPLAFLSWRLLERPVLARKRTAITISEA